MHDHHYYIGIMSGTSSDAADAVLIKTNPRFELIATHSHQFDSSLQKSIHELADPQTGTIEKLGALDCQLGEIFATTVNELLQKTSTDKKNIVAIGSHGQTIRHRPPPHAHPFSLQIGDPNIIASRTGINVVADFRRRDIAHGGQGAPLVPAFHQAVFSHQKIDRVMVNIGGMANITWLPHSGEISGFDTGPGNVLMDLWIQKHLQKNFDPNGEWAKQGNVNIELLDLLLDEEFFQRPAPKSTGREAFNLDWLMQKIQRCSTTVSIVDIQRSLLELTAQTISKSIQQLGNSAKEIFVCGGGAFNDLLMQRLHELAAPEKVQSTSLLGVDPQWVEAMAFAWLAYRRMENLPGNICTVTGAQCEAVLGAVYSAN